MPDCPWSHAAVFVSSTWLNLQPERKAVEVVLQRFRDTKFVGMEYFGSQDDTPEAASLAEVDRSHLYIGVIGPRYGSGVTEAEYRAARKKGLDCLIYFSTDTAGAAEHDPPLARFCAELRKAHTVTEFRSADDLAARVAADLHNWLMNRWLTTGFLKTSVEGINELPTDYSNRIQNFLHEYLGGENRPVPFGGRAKEIAQLDEWLESGTPYGIIAAPAGRGKSALVTRWARGLLTRPDTNVVFFPVSIRFRTNLASVVFVSLAARLARIFGEELRTSVEMTAEVCRGLVASYLRRGGLAGGRIVLVVDGLDEAADWEAGADLFPMDPPPNVHVLVTARYRAGDVDARSWLAALGWPPATVRPIDLLPLSREGLRDVLVRMGAPLDKLVTKVDVVSELFRLSEGDPLLVRLYVDDLWLLGAAANRLNPQDLLGINPGLEGYFERWWREQNVLWKTEAPLRERSVQAVLNLLACSLGPLKREDLLRLAPADAALNTWTLDAALQPLGRFVIRDGRTQGYVLSHPRLANYFYDLLTPPERRYWESRFIDWGAESLAALRAGELPAEEAPDYLVQFYGAHLERSQAGAAKLLALVDDGWRRAWLAHEGAYTGFLNDVERAWHAAEAADRKQAERGAKPQDLPSSIRCALCTASVRSLATNVRPEMLAALVKQRIWTAAQSLAFLRQMPTDQQRYDGLRVIAELLPPELVDQAAAVPMPHLPAELAGRLAACGRGDRALEIARGLEWNNEALAPVLLSIGPHLSSADSETALALAGGLPSRQRVEVTLALLGPLSEARRTEILEAGLRAAILEAFEGGIHTIAAIAGAGFVTRIARTAVLPGDGFDALLVTSALTGYLPAGERSGRIAEIIHGIEEQRSFGQYADHRGHSVLANLLPFWSVEERRPVLERMIAEEPPEDLVRRVKPYLEPGQVLRLLGIGREIRPRLLPLLADRVPHEAWGTLLEPLLAEGIDAALMSQVYAALPDPIFAEVRDRIMALEDDDDCEFGLWAIAPRLTAADIAAALERGLWLAENVRLCEALGRRFAELGRWREALDLASRPRKADHQNRVLIAVGQAARGDPEALRAVVVTAAQRPYAPETLGAIAGVLPPHLLREALAAVQRINDQTAQAAAYQYLLLELVESGRIAEAHRTAQVSRASLPAEWLANYASVLAKSGHIDEAFDVATWTRDERVLRSILAAARDDSAFRRAIQIVEARENVDWTLCREMLEQWPVNMEDEALEFVSRTAAVSHLGEGVAILAGRLPDAPGRLFPLACSISDTGSRIEALAALAGAGNHREESVRFLAAAAAGEDGFGAASEALLKLAPLLGDEDRALVIRKVLAADDSVKERAIVRLEQAEAFWPDLKQITGSLPEMSVEVAAVLLLHAAGSERETLSALAMEAVRKLAPWNRYQWLVQLAPRMAEPLAQKAWLDAWTLALENQWTWVAGDLLRTMPDALVESAVSFWEDRETMESLQEHLQPGSTARTVLAAKLATRPLPQRSPAERRLTVGQIAEIQSPWDRAFALTAHGWSDEEEWAMFQIAQAIPERGASAYAVGDFLFQARTAKVRAAAEAEAMKLAVSGHLSRAQVVEALRRTRWRADPEWQAVALRLLDAELATASAHRSAIDTDLISELGRALPPAESYILWSRVLRLLSLGTRAELLAALKPMLQWWGGGELLEGATEAVSHVLAWWP